MRVRIPNVDVREHVAHNASIRGVHVSEIDGNVHCDYD